MSTAGPETYLELLEGFLGRWPKESILITAILCWFVSFSLVVGVVAFIVFYLLHFIFYFYFLIFYLMLFS